MSFTSTNGTPTNTTPLSTTGSFEEIYPTLQVQIEDLKSEIFKHSVLKVEYENLKTLSYEETIQLDFVKQKRESLPNLMLTKDGKSSIMSQPNSPVDNDLTTYNDLQQVILNADVVDVPREQIKEQDLENVLDDLLRPTFAKIGNRPTKV